MGKNRSREAQRKYLDTFSTANWVKLDHLSKQKHNLCCEECKFDEIHTTFPAGKQKVKRKTSHLKPKKRMLEKCNSSLTNDLENILDASFSKLNENDCNPPKKTKISSKWKKIMKRL